MNNSEAEILKKRYTYRRLILNGKLNVPINLARRLIGTDSAYHLYQRMKSQFKTTDIKTTKTD